MMKHISIKITGGCRGLVLDFALTKNSRNWVGRQSGKHPRPRSFGRGRRSGRKTGIAGGMVPQRPAGAKVDRVEVSELSEPFVPLKMG